MPAAPVIVTKKQLVNAFSLCLQAQVPVLLVGRPGEGKTSIAKAIAKKLAWPIHVLPVPGKREPAQVIGLPQRLENVSRWVPYEWILALKEAPHSIVFLDDLAEASRDMQAFFLELVYGRRFGDVVLENASMAAAANPDEGHLDLTPALANRLVHLQWKISAIEFATDFAADFPEPEVPILDPSWIEHRGIWRQTVAEFLRTIPDLRQPDPTMTELLREEAGPFPSQRTWDFGATLLAASGSLGLSELEQQQLQVLLLQSTVGVATANSFFAWRAGKGLPRPEELLERPARIKDAAFKNRPDTTWIAVLSVLRHTLFNLAEPTVWDSAWRFLDYLAETGQVQFGVNAARILYQRRPAARKGKDPAETRHYSRMLEALTKKPRG